MMSFASVLCVLLSVSSLANAKAAPSTGVKCLIAPHADKIDRPIITTIRNEVLPIAESGFIELDVDKRVKFSCPGQQSGEFLDFKCNENGNFSYPKIASSTVVSFVDVNSLSCTKMQSSVEPVPVKGGSLVRKDVGFRFANQFLPVYSVFQDAAGNTVYVNYTLTQYNQKHRSKSDFSEHWTKEADYPVKDVDDLYKKTSQATKFPWLNTNEARSTIQRGHLATRSHFTFEYQQKATFKYINAAPQFGSLNMGSWKCMEGFLSKYASENGDVKIYSGTAGIAKYRDAELFLQQPNLRVPKYFWKIMIDPRARKSIAFIGANSVPGLVESDLGTVKDICNSGGHAHEGSDTKCISVTTLRDLIKTEMPSNAFPEDTLPITGFECLLNTPRTNKPKGSK